MTDTHSCVPSTPPTNNPLLQRCAAIPFDRFSHTQIEPAIDALLTQSRHELAAIKQVAGARTFENTLRALDRLALDLNFAMGVVGHLESVATTPEWRAAYNSVIPRVTEFSSQVALDPELWTALKGYAETEEAHALTGHRARFLEKTLAEFRRNGADLAPDKKAELSAINTELAELTTKFSQNTLDATNAFEFHTQAPEELAGLPESALQMGRAAAAAKGLEGWRFTLQAPSYIAIMTYADSRTLRERFYRAYNSRCSSGELSNVSLLYRILDLRTRKAALLGFKDFSDLVLADRMAKNGARAQAFVEELRAHVAPAVEREHAELQDFVRSELNLDPSTLAPWDLAYVAEKMRRAQYDFDEEELRPYFPLPRVLNGLFTIVERTFGISVRPTNDLTTWDKDVSTFSAYDVASGSLLGHFYVDLFPRENKRGGAWMNHFITHTTGAGDELPHIGLIAGNFTPPQPAHPSLLTHDEVTTLFHEFGHLMHQLCGVSELHGQSMSGVAWDFIELPSQILENWCWDRQCIDLFAAHFENGSPLPDELFAKVLRARNFRSGTFLQRQVGFSTVDLALHRGYDRARDGDLLEYCRAIAQRHTSVRLEEDFASIASFTHLFASPVGYAAGYYSYQWAEVLDADAFSRFEAEGIMNPRVGAEFRECILSRGDTEDAERLFHAFMGRGPQIAALLKRSGLA